MTLTIVGTSHIAKDSQKKIKAAIKEHDPEIIAIELDRRRLASLVKKKDDKKKKSSLKTYLPLMRKIGIRGVFFALLASWGERKLGKLIGSESGIDMKTAIDHARKEKRKLALIDQDITITLQKLTKALGWREAKTFGSDLFKGLILRQKEKIPFDLNTVPDEELIETLLERVKKQYPRVYKVLVEERNEVIAKNIRALQKHSPDASILVVLGAGHKREVQRILAEKEGLVQVFQDEINIGQTEVSVKDVKMSGKKIKI